MRSPKEKFRWLVLVAKTQKLRSVSREQVVPLIASLLPPLPLTRVDRLFTFDERPRVERKRSDTKSYSQNPVLI